VRDTKVKCDGCERDLTSTGNSVDYRLVLESESIPPWYREEGLSGGVVTDMLIDPPIDRAHHFCSLGCLDKWRQAKQPESDLKANLLAIRSVVDRQAGDESLWAVPPAGTQPITEAYLQQELRHLHKVVEDYTKGLA
jgi:hypothetical protein